MRRLLPVLVLTTLVLVLTACGGGPRKRIFPPQASVQEIAVRADGRWRVTLRLQNYSNVPMRFANVATGLNIAGTDAGRLTTSLDLSIGPENADIVIVTFDPAPAARDAVSAALSQRRNLRYTLDGRIATSDPKGDYPFTFQSALSPIPGLDGVLR